MSRCSASCLVGMLAVLATAGPLAAQEASPNLKSLLADVDVQETAEHFAIAYVRLKTLERAAKEAESAEMLAVVEERAPFLASSARREVRDHLDRFLRAEAQKTPAIQQVVLGGPAYEPLFTTECDYDEEHRFYACTARLEGGTYTCVVTSGAPRCGREGEGDGEAASD